MEKEMKLNNGVMIPTPGFGTFLTPDGATCVNAVKCAISSGYTHIDTAAVYDKTTQNYVTKESI